jgi:hypothetical protein
MQRGPLRQSWRQYGPHEWAFFFWPLSAAADANMQNKNNIEANSAEKPKLYTALLYVFASAAHVVDGNPEIHAATINADVTAIGAMTARHQFGSISAFFMPIAFS